MPFSNGSATALGVKAHVLYSQLLKADEYWALLGLKSTTEIAAFLKQTAGYKDKFETLVPANVHRIDLENALRSSVLAEAESFLFYLLGVWRDFFLDWLSWYEAEQLKSIFRWIHSKRLDRDEMRRRLYHTGRILKFQSIFLASPLICPSFSAYPSTDAVFSGD